MSVPSLVLLPADEVLKHYVTSRGNHYVAHGPTEREPTPGPMRCDPQIFADLFARTRKNNDRADMGPTRCLHKGTFPVMVHLSHVPATTAGLSGYRHEDFHDTGAFEEKSTFHQGNRGRTPKTCLRKKMSQARLEFLEADNEVLRCVLGLRKSEAAKICNTNKKSHFRETSAIGGTGPDYHE